ncbi:DUF4347 domain-containing protein [Methylomonas sp. MK1]|uniref:DUF4347 domain-containing protein n=1 Tax=Methylomonas sp. MK1 TaxID=1131552 RepID=UPI001360B128|nr:DUF4347 domain-containing protein [Methylomonas sp. MK1]
MNSKSHLKHYHSKPILEELESRQLFSGGIEGLLTEQLMDPNATYANATPPADTQQPPTQTSASETSRNEIVFVDTRVLGYESLLNDIKRSDVSDRNLEIITLDSSTNGIQQITQILAERDNLDAVHIISHGSDGSLDLGNSQLNFDTLIQNQTDISAWGDSFNANGDILLYGCNVAETQFGQSFVEYLSGITNTEVAASEDTTGSADLGGDWLLEYQSGDVETEIVVSAAGQSEWTGLMAVTANGTVTSTDSTSTSQLTWSHKVNAGIDRVLFVEIAIDDGNAGVNSVKYGAADLTRVGRTAANHAVEIWALVNPTEGTDNVVISFTGNTEATAGASTFNGVNQSTPYGTYAGNTGTTGLLGGSGTVNVASATGDLVIDVQYWKAISADTTGTGQTSQWTSSSLLSTAKAGSSVAEGASSVTMSGSALLAADWSIGAVSVKASINIAPVNTVPAAQTTNEDTAKVFSSANGNTITIADADAGGANNEITLTVTNGTLTLAGTTGLTFLAGDGTADSTMTLRGSASAINTALNGLSFTPTAEYIGSATLTLTTKDSVLLGLDIDTGLLGRYAFENTGTLGTDSSPAAGYAGSVINGIAVSDATRGTVLSLAGDGYVQTTGLYGQPSSVTLAAWVNLTSADTGGAEVISLGDNVLLRLDAGGKIKGSYVDSGTFRFTETATTLAGTGWHHVAYTIDSAAHTQTVYIDGVAVASTAYTTSIAYSQGSNSFIGKHGNGGTTYDFNGKIDDARVYNRALTTAEIATLAKDLTLTDTDTVAITVAAVNDAPNDLYSINGVAKSDLVGVYGVNNLANLGRDDAGNNAPITFYSNPGQTTGPNGSGALDLAGGTSGQYGDISGITTGGAMTFAASVKFDSTGDWQRVFDFGQTDSTGIGNIYVGREWNTNNLTFTIEKNGAYTYRATAANAITNGSWLHFAATVDASGNMNLYVNGNLAASTAGVALETGVRSNNFIGKSHWAGDAAFDGAIDNFIVANGVMSAANVAALYQQTTGFTVAENAANGTVVGTVVGFDIDASANPTYSLTDSAGGRFALGTDGTISVADGSRLDFETASSHIITVRVTDAGGATYDENFTIQLLNVNEAPIISGIEGTALAYTENGPATAVTSTLVLSDVDSANLAGATVQISGNYASGQDVLAFTDQNGITGSWNASTGTLTLSGSATVAQYQTALRSITYENTSDAPSTASRTVSFSVIDGTTASNITTRSIAVTAINDAPVNSLPANGYTAINTSKTFSSANGDALQIADVDAASSSVQLTLSISHGSLSLASTTGMTLVSGANGSGSMSYSGTVAAINTALNNGLTFTPDSNYRGLAQLTMTTSDQGNAGTGGTLTDTDTLDVHVGAIVVTNTSDTISAGANTSSISALIASDGGDGISLREAIAAANNTAGPNYIYFGISGTSVHTINLTSALTITSTIVLDATSDDSFSANGSRPAIVLNGAGNIQNGIQLYGGSDGSTIRGLVIQNFAGTGIEISGSNGNTVAGNWIGLNAAGTGAAGNSAGIGIWNSANNIIGGSSVADRNVISGNTGIGIGLSTDNGSATGNQIKGNYIGTDVTGANAVGNANQGIWVNAAGNIIGGTIAGEGNVISGTTNWVGIQLEAPASNTLVAGNLIGLNAAGTAAIANAAGGIYVQSANNTIGGTTAAARNFISGNNGSGITLTGSSATGNVITGNYIGTDISGTVDLGNANSGITIESSGNTVGGTASGAGNLLSGNSYSGVFINGESADNNVIQGNYIGTDVSGNAGLANSWDGISVIGGADNTVIGGITAAARNIIAGNTEAGVYISDNGTTGTVVQGNYIGVSTDGVTALGNGIQGVAIENSASSNLIGGTAAGAGNIIANNDVGITVVGTSSSNVFLENSIYGNTRLGIDLGDDGATANDAGDVDSGPNSLLNTMVLTRATVNGTNLTLSGTYNGAANSYYRIEVYSDTTASGEGPTFLNAVNMAVGSSGTVNIQFNFSDARLATGQYLTVTATRTHSSYSTFYETSEFSNAVITETPDSAPVGQDQTITVTEDTAYTFTTANFPFTDVDGNNLSQVWIESLPASGTLYLNGVAVQELDANSAADIQSGKLTYTPATNSTAATSFLFSIVDDGSSYGGGQTLDSTANTLTINITAVNDAPVFANLNGAPTFIENGSAVVLDADVTLFDAELSGTNNFNGSTLTLARHGGANAEDALAFDGITVTVSGADVYVGGVQVGTYTFTGGQMEITFGANATNDRVNTLMRNTVYWNWSDTPPASVQIDWTFSDVNAGAQGGGGALTTSGNTTVSINAVNDAPVINVVSARTTDEDVVKRFSAWIGNAITISDVDAGSANLEMTISAISGTVTLGGLVGLTFSVGDGAADTTMTFRGTLAAINTALDNIDYMPAPNYSGPGGMEFTLNDLGNTGTGGGLIATATQVITVNPINDAPTATITPASYSATEQTSLTLHGTGLNIADVDAGSSNVQATVSVVSGTLTANAGTTGVTVSGSGTSSITLTGSLSQINDLLAGNASGSLSYIINSDTPPATDTLTLSVNDQGNTGSGGALTGFDVATINITAVNDAPVNTVYGDGTSVPEDSVIQMLGSVVISDVDSGSGTVTSTLSVSTAAGVFSATSAGGVTISGSGTNSLVLSGDVASINAYFASAATAPVFTTTADYNDNGAVSFTVVTTDNGNSGSGGALSDSDTISGLISAVADIANDSVTTNEDTPVTFDPLANDTFENSGRYISAIDGINISSGQTVAITDGNVTLNANGTLTFTPTANSNGATSFSYSVTSGGATETATVAVTINPVNDAPVLSFATSNVSYPENAGAVILAPNATVTDADLTNFDDGQMVIEFSTNGQAEDRLSIRNQGTASGQIGLSGNDVTYSGVVIGSFTGGTDGATPLVISFTSNASVAAVQALGRNISYQNVSDAPSSLVRTLQGYVTDGDGGTSNVVSGTLSITASNDAPVISSANLTFNEGETVTLSAANFGVTDPDNTSFTYTVSSVSGGYFQLTSAANTPITSFTTAQLSAGQVQFVDDGNKVAPNFDVTVSDGSASSTTMAASIDYSASNDTTNTLRDIITYNQKNGLNDKNQGDNAQTNISASHHVSTDQFAVVVDLNTPIEQLTRQPGRDNQATGNQFILEPSTWINDGNSPRLSGLIDSNKSEPQGSSENSRKYHFQSRIPLVEEYRIDSQTALSEQEEMEFWNRLENIRKQMSDPTVVADANPVNIKIILGTSAGLTAGFVSWILRAGSLMASFMSTVPLLKRFDPLPIMRSVKKSRPAKDHEANELDSVSSQSEDTR